MLVKILHFAGSLCFLLYGMKLMSDGIQKSAGQKLKKALAFMTGNRFVGLLTGCLLTMIIQSSGATTVMVVSFVNAGLVTLEQSIGVIFGANIGTTITAWVVALFGFNFKIEAFAIPIFGLGYLLTLIKKFKKEGLGMAVMGFGILFLGLSWLSKAFQLDSGPVMAIFQAVQGHGILTILLGVVVSMIFTALIHSSSAMTAIVITMAYNKIIGWEFGAAMVIGSEMGSTIDSIMAAAGAKSSAKSCALIHVMFNVATSFLALIFFKPFLSFVDFVVPGRIEDNMIFHIAALHTSFKVFGTVIFIPFTRQIAHLAQTLIKEKTEEKVMTYTLEFSEKTAAEYPESMVIRAQKEIADFADIVVDMFDNLQAGLKNRDKDFVEEGFPKIEQLEDYTDQMHRELTHYLVKCSRLNISEDAKDNVSLMMQISEEMESMGDSCLSIASQIKKAVEKKMPFRQEDMDRLLPYFELARQFMYFIHKNVAKIERLSPDQFQFATEIEQQIDDERKALKKVARKRLESGADVKAELLYIDIVRQIEKIGDRCFDVAGELGKNAKK